MRVGPAFRSSFFVLSAGSVLGLGCFLNSAAFDSGGASGTTTTTTSSTSTTTTTTSMGGAGGNTTTSPGGGGSGGGTGGMTTTSMGGGGTGGTTGGGGTGGVLLPTSCATALAMGVTQSGVVTIDPDTEALPEPAIQVYCDQVNMGGGWALVYSSVGDMAGQTTAFWDISWDDRFAILPPAADPSPAVNYYAGKLYKFGTEYRDDVVDTMGVEAIGVVHAKATSIEVTQMHFIGPVKMADNLSDDLFNSHFAAGWSSATHDYDYDANRNCASTYANVTQHYGGCWYYNLGADTEPVMGSSPPDYSDAGWGPHLSNGTIEKINTALAAAGKGIVLSKEGDPSPSFSSRMNRISRFARW